MGFITITPWKINMEPTNHPCRKENDLPNLHEDMVQPLIFQGVFHASPPFGFWKVFVGMLQRVPTKKKRFDIMKSKRIFFVEAFKGGDNGYLPYFWYTKTPRVF